MVVRHIFRLSTVIVILLLSGCEFWWSVPYAPYLPYLDGEVLLAPRVSSNLNEIRLEMVPGAGVIPDGSPEATHVLIHTRAEENRAWQGFWISRDLRIAAEISRTDGPQFLASPFRTVDGGFQLGNRNLTASPDSPNWEQRFKEPPGMSGLAIIPDGNPTHTAEVYVAMDVSYGGVSFRKLNGLYDEVPSTIQQGDFFEPDLPDVKDFRFGVGQIAGGEAVFWVVVRNAAGTVLFRQFTLSEVEALQSPSAWFVFPEDEDFVQLQGVIGSEMHHGTPMYLTERGFVVFRRSQRDDKPDQYVAINPLTGKLLGALDLDTSRRSRGRTIVAPDPTGEFSLLYMGDTQRLFRLGRWW